jgi:hypothetical protein
MLRAILVVIGAVVALAVLVLVLLVLNFVRASRRQRGQREARLEPLVRSLSRGERPDPALVNELAAEPFTRRGLLDLLLAGKHADAFPPQYMTRALLAESDLAYWLAHGNELGEPPREFELVHSATVDADEPVGRVEYFLFRFRTRPPHWAADRGWMAGVAGPYRPGEEDPLTMGGTGAFSELEPFAARSRDDHVAQLHRSVAQRGGLDDLKKT